MATITPWVVAGVLAALLVATGAGLVLLLAMGRLGLDLDWGRSRHRLGPIAIRIEAPPELVFELIEAPYSGRARVEGIEVLARDTNMAVAAHLTRVHFYTARTIEVIELERPRLVRFRHLHGPVPYAVEQFELGAVDDATELRYGGEVGLDFFALGRIAARRWVVPQWEAVVRTHLEDLTRRAEERAARRAARGA